MYRALAHVALQTQTDLDNEPALLRLFVQNPIDVQLDRAGPLGFRIFTGTSELAAEQLESSQVTAVVSTIAAHACIREAMVAQQRAIARQGSVVMAGRDIGSIVLPHASVKVFLTASVEARVGRRRAQLAAAGVDVNAHELAREIEERDRLDETRSSSPLKKAPDAHAIDSSRLTADEVVDRICALVRASS